MIDAGAAQQIADDPDFADAKKRASGYWAILRKGKENGSIRVRRFHDGFDFANDHFDREWPAVRQGWMALLSPEGEVRRFGSEPYARTRW